MVRTIKKGAWGSGKKTPAMLGRLARVVIAGVLLWASFPDVNAWFLSFPALALVISVVDQVTPWRAGVYGTLFGIVFWLPHVQWAQIAASGTLPWIALALTQVLWWAVWAWSVRLCRYLEWSHTVWGQVLVYSVAWVAIEQGRSHFPFTGFPWASLAYPQVDSPLGHLAPWGGQVLVSGVVVAVAVLLRRAVSLGESPEDNHWWKRPVLVLSAVALVVLPGAINLPNGQQEGAVRIAAVQGNVEVPGAQTYAVEGKVTGNHVAVTQDLLQAGEKMDLLVWGEGAADRDPRFSRLIAEKINRTVSDAKVPLLVGFNEYDPEREVIHNLYATWYPGAGLDKQMYGKQLPVPFGEYIPFRPFISALATEAAQIRVDMEAVDNPPRMDVTLPDGRVLPVTVGICFEVAYESLFAEGVLDGGQIIITPTNNYHFRSSPESTQQAQMARFRAMEFSRSVVQVSTTGVSMMIRPDGGVLAQTEKESADYLVAELPLRSAVTPVAVFGDFFQKGVMVAYGILIAAGLIRWGKSKKLVN